MRAVSRLPVFAPRGLLGLVRHATTLHTQLCVSFTAPLFPSPAPLRSGRHFSSAAGHEQGEPQTQDEPFSPRFEVLCNEQIVFPLVRVIDDKGFVGDMAPQEGTALAKERGVDLVLFRALTAPPTCKLMPVTEYIRQQEAKETDREEKRKRDLENQYAFDPALKVKGVRISGVAEEADFQRKVKQAREFLKKGHRIEVQIMRGGGDAAHAIARTQRVVSELKDLAKPLSLPQPLSQFEQAMTVIRFWPCTPEQAAAFRVPPITWDDGAPSSAHPTAAERRAKENHEPKRETAKHTKTNPAAIGRPPAPKKHNGAE